MELFVPPELDERDRSNESLPSMMIFEIAGAACVLLFLAAVMTGIEGNEYR